MVIQPIVYVPSCRTDVPEAHTRKVGSVTRRSFLDITSVHTMSELLDSPCLRRVLNGAVFGGALGGSIGNPLSSPSLSSHTSSPTGAIYGTYEAFRYRVRLFRLFISFNRFSGPRDLQDPSHRPNNPQLHRRECSSQLSGRDASLKSPVSSCVVCFWEQVLCYTVARTEVKTKPSKN